MTHPYGTYARRERGRDGLYGLYRIIVQTCEVGLHSRRDVGFHSRRDHIIV